MIGMKICHACGKNKPLSDFHRNKRTKDGAQTQCKACMAAHNAKHYRENKEHHRETHATYYRTHRQQILSRHKEYYKSHKPEKAIYGRQYQQSHKAEHNAWKRKWRAQNKDKVADYARKARQNPVKHEKVRLLKIVRRAFAYQGLSKSPTVEAICKCTPMKLHQHLCLSWGKNYGQPYEGEPCEIDHIKPLKTATTIEEVQSLYHYTNLQLLTKEDNRAKECSNPTVLCH